MTYFILNYFIYNKGYSRLLVERDSFNIINGTGDKVGSMVWEKSIQDNTYLMKDYSKFDDGSVDETASLYINLDSMKTLKVETDMAFPNGGSNLNFAFNNQTITGKYIINRDSSERTIDIDTTFNYNIVRGEIYMLLHALDIKTKTNFNTFVSTSMTVANSSIEVLGSEEITVPEGIFEATKIELKGGGKLPDNTIWVSNNSPKIIVKATVEGQDLDIVLVSYIN
jgi:hypothetical protein